MSYASFATIIYPYKAMYWYTPCSAFLIGRAYIYMRAGPCSTTCTGAAARDLTVIIYIVKVRCGSGVRRSSAAAAREVAGLTRCPRHTQDSHRHRQSRTVHVVLEHVRGDVSA